MTSDVFRGWFGACFFPEFYVWGKQILLKWIYDKSTLISVHVIKKI